MAPRLLRTDSVGEDFESLEEEGGVLEEPSSLEGSLEEEGEAGSLEFDFFFFPPPTRESHCFSILPRLECGTFVN